MNPVGLIVGADDYGLSPGVSAGILSLIDRGALSATSCMTTFPEWPEAAAHLRHARPVALGLHLTLTDFEPLGPCRSLAPAGRFPSLGQLWRRALTGGLPANELHDELSRQLDRFEQRLGRPPDYLDGHHHVQQLPVVRDVVVALAAARLPRPWVRTCVEAPRAALRRQEGLSRALAFSAAGRGLHQRLHRAALASNDGFTGVYDFSPARPYAERFARFLLGARDRTFLMCHPGRVDPTLRARDSLQAQRERELDWLGSEACAELLLARGLRLIAP